MQDEETVRRYVMKRADAMHTGDTKTLCQGYTDDAVVFDLAPPLVRPLGATGDVDRMQAWFDGKGGSVWSEVRDLQVTVDGGLALCTSLVSLGAPADSPQPFALWSRSTLGLRRLEGAWRIIHEHRSTPFYLDGSFRAATDLTPKA